MRTAFVGMGGNVASWAGGPEATLAAAAVRLGTLGRVVAQSSLYSTEPVGFAEQPRFVNAVVGLETELAAGALLRGLLGIELEFGRERTAGLQNGPRTLDLDILLFGDEVLREPGLEVPHPRLAQRAFVLVPLGEIAAGTMVPGIDTSVGELLERLPCPDDETDAVVRIESDAWGETGFGGGLPGGGSAGPA